MGQSQSGQQQRPKTVCVVGAGVSGLRAALLLVESGFQVTILEARNRIGGRIQQDSRLGLPLDTGASWIHGTQGNPLVDLAEKAGSTTVACGTVYSICRQDGNWLNRNIAGDRYEEVWEILETGMKKSRDQSTSLPDCTKMMDFFRHEVATRRSKARDPEEYESLMIQIVEMWGAFMGDECERQSFKNLWLDAGIEGGEYGLYVADCGVSPAYFRIDNLLLASTYKDILTGISSPAIAKTTLRCCCEVTRIENRQDGVVFVEAADGFRESYGHVIVTAPLGWLKRNEEVFSPALHPRISKAIHKLGYGNLDKIFIKFPRAFWDDAAPEVDVHAPLKSQTDLHGKFPIESLFLTPEYAPDTNPARWRTEIISFSGLPDPYAQPIIMFFVYGQWGRHVTGLVRGMKEDSPEYCGILDGIFRPCYSKLPHYDPASPDCRPTNFLSTDWQNDRFAGYGSFTNQPVGSGDCAQHFETLREGMGKERGIWFAGEHTSPPGGLGTVTGAYWSGEEVAKRILGSYKSFEA